MRELTECSPPSTPERSRLVLTQKNQMRAVLLTVERYSELERNAA